MFEQGIPDSSQSSLSNRNHDSVVGIVRKNSDRIESRSFKNCMNQRSEISASTLYHRINVIINKNLHEKCSLKIRQNAYQYENEYQNHLESIIFKYIAHQAFKYLAWVFNCGLHPSRSSPLWCWHILPPLFIYLSNNYPLNLFIKIF